VLGVDAMGHGMATSALRAGIPIVWNREPTATRDLADAAGRAAIVGPVVTLGRRRRPRRPRPERTRPGGDQPWSGAGMAQGDAYGA
jgi:hypothetical protein